jgi:hypothetical protein
MSTDFVLVEYRLVHVMLDEVVNSTVHRCVEPEMMESSVSVVKCVDKRAQSLF